MQRVHRDDSSAEQFAVGLGYGEALRWFGPIDDAYKRRLIIGYAEAVLEADGFPAHTTALSAWEHGRAADAGHSTSGNDATPGRDARPRSDAVTEGLVLLSHAETDLLALERARSELPPGFPAVAGHSLIGLSASALFALFGTRRSHRLVVVARLHGNVASVPGLSDLIALAHREGWALVVISGAGGSTDLLPRTSNVEPEFASNLTSYFMAGGVGNVGQALRYAARTHLAFDTDFDPPRAMPAHGLYHPDLLVTNAAEWASHRALDRPTAIVLFYRAHVLSGNLQFVDATLRALESHGFAAIGVFTSSLRDRDASGIPLALRLLPLYPDVIVNTIGFPVFTLNSTEALPPQQELNPFRGDRRAADPSDLLRDPTRDVERVFPRFESGRGCHERCIAGMRRPGHFGAHHLQGKSSVPA